MKMAKYEISIMGTVERRVIVSGNSFAEAEANAFTEWAALTGGYIGTAESIEAHKIEENEDA
jgi:presenilin-like A22 family membrane protease